MCGEKKVKPTIPLQEGNLLAFLALSSGKHKITKWWDDLSIYKDFSPKNLIGISS